MSHTVNSDPILTIVGATRPPSSFSYGAAQKGHEITLIDGNSIHEVHHMKLRICRRIGYIKRFMELFFFYAYGINWAA